MSNKAKDQIEIEYIEQVKKTKNGLLLDLGCGSTVYKFGGISDNIFRIDINRKKLLRTQMTSNKKSRNICGDINILPFHNKTFSCIIASFIICSKRNNDKLLKEIRRVLIPGGKFISLEHLPPKSLPMNVVFGLINPIHKIFFDCDLLNTPKDNYQGFILRAKKIIENNIQSYSLREFIKFE